MPGHVKKLKPGKYRISVEAGRDISGKRKRIVRVVECDKPTAEKIKDALIAELESGSYISPAKVTAGEWLSTWINDYKKIELRGTTLETYKYIAYKHIIPYIETVPLSQLTTDHLQYLYNLKKDSGLSSSTVKYIHIIIHGALEQAVLNKMIKYNVSKSTKRPQTGKSKGRALTMDEEDMLLRELARTKKDGITDYYFHRVAFILMLRAGLRRAETLGLSWPDIDFGERTVNINRTLVYADKQITLQEETKTKTSTRLLPLSGSVADEIKRHRQNMLSLGLYKKDGLVFTTRKGTPIHPRNINSSLANIYKNAGIEDATPHSLRHTFATRLLEKGVPMKVAQELLGHKDMSTTADTYSHVSPELKREAIDLLDEK